MTGLLASAAYALGCTGAGALLLRALSARPARYAAGLPCLATAFVLGQALIAALWIALALAGAFTRSMLAGVMLAGMLAGASTCVMLVRERIPACRAALAWLRGERPGVKLIALGLGFFVVASALAAWFQPPFGDAEAFYVVYARLIAATARLEAMPGIYEGFSSIGVMGELHMAALIALAGVPAAKLFVWAAGMAAAPLLASVCAAAGVGRFGQLVAVALLFTSSAFTFHLFDGKVDLFAVALGLAAVRWIMALPREAPERAALAVCGLACGFAFVAKFSFALASAPALLVLLAYRGLNVRRAIAFAAWAGLAVVPHVLKNAVLFHAPLAPFVGGPGSAAYLEQVWFGPEVTLRIVLTYPLALVLGRYPMQGGNLTYLALAFLPLVLFVPKSERQRSSPLVQLCVAGAAGMILWVALRPSIIAPRYYLATLLLFVPVLARAVEALWQREDPPRWLSAGALVVLLGALTFLSYPMLPAMARALPATSADPCRLASHYCAAFQPVNREADEGARVYLAGYYGYWLRDDLLVCRDRGHEYRLLDEGAKALTWQALADAGFAWLIVDLSTHQQAWRALSAKPLPAYLRTSVREASGLIIVRLSDSRPEGKRPPCGRWQSALAAGNAR
jgi:hypothetical protein